MSQEIEDMKKDVETVTVEVKKMTDAVLGTYDKPGILNIMHDNKKRITKTETDIQDLEKHDKTKVMKELAVAGSIILILIGIILNLMRG